MKKEVFNIILELTVWGAVMGALASFVKGVKEIREYVANSIASVIVILPTGLYLEGSVENPYIKYSIIALVCPLGMGIFHFALKLVRQASEDPCGFIGRLLNRCKRDE